MSRTRSRTAVIPDLLTGLVDPRLLGAKCVSRSPLFDDELYGETVEQRSDRLAYAANICRGCPVQSACRTAVAELDHPTGIWAGHLIDPAGTPGRPPKDSAA